MEKVASLAILLVCLMASSAHAAVRMENVGGRSTWHSHGVNGTDESSIKGPASANDSVVENWSLVCEDLCRVGFGGPRCGPSCTVGPKRQSNASKFSDFCPVLCDFALGGHNCACPNASKRKNGKTVCRVLCGKLKLKIRGCPECENAEKSLDDINAVLEISNNQTTVSSGSTPPETVTTTIMFSTNTDFSETVETTTTSSLDETTTELNSSTSQEPSTASASTETTELNSEHSSDAIETTTQALPDTTETTAANASDATQWTTTSTSAVPDTTTTESTTPTKPSTTSTPPTAPTTPNWSEVCQGLCRIGEGGSLCNCDLPPLMSI